MPIPTCNVTITVNLQSGEPAAGMRVIAELTRPDKFDGFVVRSSEQSFLNSSGKVVLPLFKNVLGETGSQYRVRALGPRGELIMETFATVPDLASANIEDISDLGPPTPANVALEAAASATAAALSADEAEASATVAVSAAEASGDIKFFDTHALADAATLDEGQVVEVFVDETRGDIRARYRFESAALVFKLDLSAVDFDSVTDLLASTATGFVEGTIIRARSEGFAYEVAASAATDHHVTTAGGVKLYVTPILSPQGQCFTARQFGAAEDTDISDALQNAINAALYNALRDGEYLQDVLIDINKGTISRTIHVGYGVPTDQGGTGRRTIDVSGLGPLYAANTGVHKGTLLTYTSTSGPAFSYQGGRKPVLRGMTIFGAAFAALQAIVVDVELSGSAAQAQAFLIPENFDIKTWDAAAAAAGVVFNRRYNPYAAVALDPRSGNRPADRAISSVTAATPAVITTSTTHDLLANGRAEAVLITGLSGSGIADGEYYAVQLTTTTAELYNLDWTSTTGTGTGTGTLARPYPDAPDYPAQEGTPDPDTDKDRTSGFIVEDCMFQGFEVGTVLNPGTLGNNGDFGEFRHVDVFYSKFAHAVCHSNARINNYARCNAFGVFAYLTSMRFGVAIGLVNARVEGMGGGYFIKWFEAVTSSRMGTTTFDNCHPEGVGMLGTFLGGGTPVQPIVFNNCVIKFQHEYISPPALLENFGADRVPITFVGCEIRSHRGLSILAQTLRFTGTYINRTITPLKPYRVMAANNGYILGNNPRTTLGSPVAKRLNIDTGAFVDTADLGEGLALSGRTNCIPWFSRQVASIAGNESVGSSVNVPPFQFVMGASQRSFGATPIAGRSITFTFTTAHNEARMKQGGLTPGNILLDTIHGTAMIIRSVNYSTRVIIATLETNWYDNGVDDAALFDPDWDYTAGTWTLFRCNVYTPPRQIFGTFTSTSNVITDVWSVGVSVTNETNFGLATDDWLAARYLTPGGIYADVDTAITAIDTGARTITLTSNAARSATNVPLEFWLRILANEADV